MQIQNLDSTTRKIQTTTISRNWKSDLPSLLEPVFVDLSCHVTEWINGYKWKDHVKKHCQKIDVDISREKLSSCYLLLRKIKNSHAIFFGSDHDG